MTLPPAVEKYYRVTRNGPTIEMRCKHPGCRKGWGLPDKEGEMKPGTVLTLLNHAYSHNED